MRDCLGLSVGTTNLVAITDRAPLMRRTDGLVFADVVERIGDPVPLVAADGSRYRAERVLADAVEALTREASPQRRPAVTVLAVPAYWQPAALAAVRRELPGVRLAPDSVAALTAIQAHPGLPARGVVALFDFGAAGTSLTLADAGAGFATIGHTVRYADFSGQSIDREMMRRVLDDPAVDASGTAAVPALARLREQCRIAKEQLSYQSAVALSEPTIRFTRAELEALIAQPLDGVIDAMWELLNRNGIHPSQVSAVVTVGGGARIPFVTQRISEAFRVAVTTVPQAQVIAAVGAALLAHRRPDETATQVVGPVPVTATSTLAASALAWSAVDDAPEVTEFVAESVSDDSARPDFVFTEEPPAAAPPRTPWYRRGGVVSYAAVFLAVVGIVGTALSVRADHLDSAVSAGAALAAPQSRPAESPLAQDAPAPPTRTVVVRDPAGPVQDAARPVAAPRRVQSAPIAPAAPPAAAPVAAEPVAAPAPAAPVPAAVPVPQLPVPQLVIPAVPLPRLPLPRLPIPTSRPPAPSPEPTPTVEPTAEPTPTGEPTAEPTPTTTEPTPTSEAPASR